MKKLLLAMALLLSVSAFAQKDTTIGIAIVPVISTDLLGKSDTAFYLGIEVNKLRLDPGNSCQLTITLYGRKNTAKHSFELTLPAEIVSKWGADDTIVYDYVFSNTRFKRK